MKPPDSHPCIPYVLHTLHALELKIQITAFTDLRTEVGLPCRIDCRSKIITLRYTFGHAISNRIYVGMAKASVAQGGKVSLGTNIQTACVCPGELYIAKRVG